ncbi:MAG: hypothetical protein AAB528_03205 [Chloroflexota bacterium]
MSTTEMLATPVSAAGFRALPPEVVDVAKVVILVGLAVAVAGSL